MRKRKYYLILTVCLGILMLVSYLDINTQPNKTELVGKEIFEKLNNSDKCVFMLGYQECAWCQQALPIFNKATENVGIDYYYIDTKKDENRDQVFFLKEKIEGYLPEEESFLVPCVVLFCDGRIIDLYIGTLEGHNAIEYKLTFKQRMELFNIYKEMCLSIKEM